ncbi:PREDICTED: MAGUK p55 subfamily member 6 isoform X2 [Nicrophorus vespilloides]|uniref:MAGUK p55 subfamily member 6 isoform X2 n=1 Tax=Nicrophorus vespilloides TaxID=110193 RepID=A0ABM1N146_NICVS|nr:PREDICTED: MAGUK p55 subfamily member 6 isoform X2 [Nicrophorus vespilloides]
MIGDKVMVKFGKKERQDRRELLASTKDMEDGDDKHNDNAAFQRVRENIEDLDCSSSGIDETDLVFLKGLMDSPVFQNLVKDRLEEPPKLPKPIGVTNKDLVSELILRCGRSRNRELRELGQLLARPHLRALIETHDKIGEVILGPKISSPKVEDILPALNGMTGETFRMVGLRRKPGEPLGLTVQVDESENLVVARILEGGMIEKQGLLHTGDVILEINGAPVYTPEELQTEIAKSKDSVTLKIGQNDTTDSSAPVTHAALVANGNAKNGINKKLTCYMRTLFQYDPEEDTLLPCKEIGLKFERGDILQIVDQKDPNWWQAKIAGTDGPVGLIPSIELEERRKAYVHPEADYVHKISICGARISKKKKKIIYQSKSNTDFDKAELLLYEEVTRMPPFKRKTLVLIGSQGVGRRTIKNRLINSDPEKFGGVVPWTTRPQRVLEENGQSYWFTDKETMEEEIRKHKFLEYGEYNGNMYGTHLDTMREIIKQGKMCVLDCSPASLKILHNSTEFLPYVIFVASPGMEHLKTLYDVGKSNSNLRHSSRNLTFDRQSSIRFSSRRARTLESLASLYEEEDLKRTLEDSASMQRTYDKYIDLVITNNDFDSTFRQVIEALESLTSEHQWVPVNWIY